MINLTIDGQLVTVPKGTTVYEAAKKIKVEIPIFCYQDRMPPFGACRVCMVEVEKMAKPQTSCTLEATEGMVVRTQSTMAVESRKEILGFLLANHPLDCPICDRGGECPLQDNTMKFGPGKSQFYEEKRHFEKPLALGPVLMLDRERCIQCARCTRFSDHIAGDQALQFIERGYRMEVGTADGAAPESKYIGNSIMICPVGALTSDVYRFRARPWDNKSTSTACTLCPVGCSSYFDQRDGEIMRTRARESRNINDIWLCDKGWFGYEFTYSNERLIEPLIKRNGHFETTSWEKALSLVASKIKEFKGSGKLAGLGGNPLTTEENFLFQQLMREGAGSNHVDHRIGMPLVEASSGMEISLDECENLSTIVICGADITEEFPVMWLRLRQSINRGARVIYFGNYAPETAFYFSDVILHPPGEEVNVLSDKMPSFRGKGAIFVGTQYLASANRNAILQALLKFKSDEVSLNLLEGNGNSFGAAFSGMRPDQGPLYARLSQSGLNVVEILNEAATKDWDFLYVAAANPALKYPEKVWKAARSNLKFMVVQDLFLTETAMDADVVLPALSFVEKEGHFVNIGGFVQKLNPSKLIPEGLLTDGEIFKKIGQKLGTPLKIADSFWEALYKGRIEHPLRLSSAQEKPASQGDFLATYATVLFDQGVRMEHNPHLIQLAKEPRIRISVREGVRHGIADGAQVIIKANESFITAKVALDPQVADRTVVLPMGFKELPVQELTMDYLNGNVVHLVIDNFSNPKETSHVG